MTTNTTTPQPPTINPEKGPHTAEGAAPCCTSTERASCCDASAKAGCCGAADSAARPPSKCGCR